MTGHSTDGRVSNSNEFTSIEVRKAFSRNGERLEISSPRLGYSIRMDPPELGSLTWHDARVFPPAAGE